MKFETIKVEVDGAIGRLTLNRPDSLNALSSKMMHELTEAAHWFDEQPDVRVVIISGAGRAFCAGADLKDAGRKAATSDPETSWMDRRAAAQSGSRMIEAVEKMRALTIASVHGYVVGGGLLLMVAADLRVAAENTIFSIPEVELGIPLAWGGIPRLVREIGPAMTKELVITCRRFSPQEAKAMGMINRVVAYEDLQSETGELAELSASMPAVPVAITKEHVNAVSRAMAGPSAYADGDVLLGAFGSAESAQARRDYVEKRLKRK